MSTSGELQITSPLAYRRTYVERGWCAYALKMLSRFSIDGGKRLRGSRRAVSPWRHFYRTGFAIAMSFLKTVMKAMWRVRWSERRHIGSKSTTTTGLIRNGYFPLPPQSSSPPRRSAITYDLDGPGCGKNIIRIANIKRVTVP